MHPSRLIHAQGGLYLIAFVLVYAEVRTFAVERIRKVTVPETTFEPVAELDADPFKHSLGVHRGGPTSKIPASNSSPDRLLVKERHGTHRSSSTIPISMISVIRLMSPMTTR